MATDCHITHPLDCPTCDWFPAGRACLSHTCPDCGCITWAEKVDGELVHECPA
jgi:hypothetical protein